MTGIVVVDKPAGMTSHAVVNRMRRLFGQRSVGHGGTLDPMATGVLPVFLGRATKASAYALEGDKTYAARFRFGLTTDTQDITGKTLTTSQELPDEEDLRAVLERFRGEILQTPPMVSAIRHDGKHLYELARAGIEVEREARRVTIGTLELYARGESPFGDAPGEGEYDVLVSCSKGTYIRTLCADIGDALGCGAALSALRRLKTGIFCAQESYTPDELEAMQAGGRLESAVLNCDVLFRELASLVLDDEEEARIRRGAPVYRLTPAGRYRLYGGDGRFLGVGAVRETDRRPELMIEKGFME